MAVFLIVCQFVMPFVFLLFRRTKDDLRHLWWIAAFLLATCFVNLVWQILPAGPADGSLAGWLDLGYGLDVLGGGGGPVRRGGRVAGGVPLAVEQGAARAAPRRGD